MLPLWAKSRAMYLRRAFSFYIRSFAGLSRDVWMLAFVSLVNRSGAMVIPFLTVYMTQELGFTKPEAGLVMSCFGIGSVIGVYAGGQLTDRFSYYYVQLWSLLLTGAAFFLLMQIKGLVPFAGGVFLLSMVAEAFRPANFASIAAYARPENITRSYSLIRLAINLGFSVGPALGGWLAHGFGFQWLFIVDGATCIAAALIFFLYLRPKKEAHKPKTELETPVTVKQSAYRDKTFLWFMLFVTLTGIAFMQFFSVIPVFWKENYGLNEAQIGSLLAMNGLLIAFVEMPLVFRLEGRVEKVVMVSMGAGMIGLSFLVYNAVSGVLFASILSVFLVTVGEMFNFPFANSIALGRSGPSNRGQYMALYAMGFSVAHILSPVIGMQVAGALGYPTLWYLLVGLTAISLTGFWLLRHRLALTSNESK